MYQLQKTFLKTLEIICDICYILLVTSIGPLTSLAWQA